MNIRQIIRTLAAIIFLATLSLIATLTGYREVVIPEMAALTVGFWVQDKQIWRINGYQTVLLLTTIAIISILIVRCLPVPVAVQFCLAFACVSGMLMLFNVTLSPAFAVGLLPVMLQIVSLSYPLVVLILSVVIVSVQRVMNITGLRRHEELRHPMRPTWRNAPRWLWLLIGIMPLMLLSAIVDQRFCLAPPLIVAYVELSNSKGGFRYRLWQTWLMLVLAALFGTAARVLLCGHWMLPEPVGVFVAVGLVFLMFGVMGKRLAPAASMSIIPFVVPTDVAPLMPLLAAIGASYLIVVARIFFIGRESAE